MQIWRVFGAVTVTFAYHVPTLAVFVGCMCEVYIPTSCQRNFADQGKT